MSILRFYERETSLNSSRNPTAEAQPSQQKLCSMPDCDELPRANQRYCPECHSKYMKAWRAKRKREVAKMQESIVKLRSTVVTQAHTIEELKVG